MEKLIIDRTKWRTGSAGETATGKGDTALLNEEGFMCCLGFECLRRGFTEDEISGQPEPETMIFNEGFKKDRFGDMVNDSGYNKSWVDEAISINDDILSTRDEKEEKIQKIFAGQGIEVEFIN